MSKIKKNIMAFLVILGIIFITVGVTYAFFSYSKAGNDENSIKTGNITFRYQEKNSSIALDDALPMTDEQGMAQSDYFEFDVSSKTSNKVQIPYYITVRSSGNGTNMDSVIKIYLTKVVNGAEIPVELLTGRNIAKVSELSKYLNQKFNIDSIDNEKAVYNGLVPVNSSNYKETYRLRMWVDSDAELLTQDTIYKCDGTIVGYNSTEYTNCDPAKLTSEIVDSYSYQGKTYALNVNVYAEGKILSTIESCPDCVFAYTTDTWYYSGTPTRLTLNQYKSDYQELIAETGKYYFLGLKLDDSGTIEKAYSCAVKDGTPFCIEGSTDGSTYITNKTLLYNIYGPYNDSTKQGCIDSKTNDDKLFVDCDANVYAFTLNDGFAETSVLGGDCYVSEEGYATCFE